MVGENIVWMTLESVRADHTTMGGYDRETTPSIQRLADERDGIAFENCFAHSMWTPASSASILSGTYLSDHGVGKEGTGMRTLPSNLTTFPARLAQEGYRTACLSPNGYLSSANGLDRGFDDFYWLSKHLGDGGPVDLVKSALNVGSERGRPLDERTRAFVKYALNVRSHGPGFTLDKDQHSLSYVTTDIAKQWLTSVAGSDEPFFLYTHLGNPHYPYCPPLPYRDLFLDSTSMTEAEAVELVLDIYSSTDKIRRLNANGSSFTAEQWEAIKALYDAEVAYVDYCVDEIVEHVRSVADGDTIFVVTADHGELFGEYGLLGHNLVLHDALVHVPLVVSGVDFDRDGDELVQHADVTQTLARIVGCGHEQFRGYDLRSETRKYCISQRGEADFDPFFDMNPDFDTTNFHEDPLTAVRTNEFKYLSSTDKTQLFALPDEETDVSDAHPELVETLSEVVHDRIDWDRSATASGTADFTDEMREQLADLGYL